MKKLKYEEWIKEITIVFDQQEKMNFHILNYFKINNIKYIKKHIKTCDYGCMLNSKVQKILIERKNGLTELSGNFSTKDKKDRFYREFNKFPDYKKILLIENDNIDNLIAGTYGSKYNKNSYIANLLLLEDRHNIKTYFVNKYNAGLWILKLFYYNYYNQ